MKLECQNHTIYQVGLNISYSKEKDWVWYKAQHNNPSGQGNYIFFLSSHQPRLSPAQYSRTSAESWPITPFIHPHVLSTGQIELWYLILHMGRSHQHVLISVSVCLSVCLLALSPTCLYADPSTCTHSPSLSVCLHVFNFQSVYY